MRARWLRIRPKRAARRWTVAAAGLAGAAVVAAQAPTFSVVGRIPGPADLIEVQGDRAYIVDGKTLSVYDLGDPTLPALRGSYSFPEKVWGIRVVDSLVYVAADFFGFGVLDVSNPSAPALRGSLKTPGQAKNVAAAGTKAVIADHMYGVDFIDVSDVAKPDLLGSYYLDGYARDVVTVGSMAYAFDSPNGVYVFDLSNALLEPVSSQQTATDPRHVVVSDTNAETASAPKIAVLVGAGLLQVYDLNNAAEPERVATFKLPGGGFGVRAALHGSRVFVADGSEGLQVLDLSTPTSPRLVGTYKTPQPARDVAVTDSLVFVVIGARTAAPGELDEQEVLILRKPSSM